MSMNHELERLARENHIEYFGIANLESKQTKDFIRAQAGDIFSMYSRAVTIGIALPKAIVDLLPTANDAIRSIYQHQVYSVISARLSVVSSVMTSCLQAAGHSVFPIPNAVVGIDPERMAAVFSDKLAPHLAGLGWIGKSCMLITPDRGPRVIWGTILTDAPLPPTGEALQSRCGSCRACVDICPAKAYTGRDFDEAEPREARFNAYACWMYIQKNLAAKGQTCGLCLYACPHGMKRHRSANPQN
jgi:epoxyqueuosine reductase